MPTAPRVYRRWMKLYGITVNYDHVTIQCRSCKREVRKNPSAVPVYPVAESYLRRMRCNRCGQRGANVLVRYAPSPDSDCDHASMIFRVLDTRLKLLWSDETEIDEFAEH